MAQHKANMQLCPQNKAICSIHKQLSLLIQNTVRYEPVMFIFCNPAGS